ncbi:hypothetical protein HCG49_03200 [Arenibacter sp. 6A1]|uniref:hypothetical protein n=1 Tax=Arenibacter sp. 6A1 TaxID=2720391 RepID=UPI001447ADAF|nr:hypothetical protein [Arenibacter sp. 6A1]NKI25564.1 hypothetical protein [Arenibacter sp. 6A1]
MKKLVVGMLLLGLASLGFSQEIKNGIEEVALSEVTVSPIINSEYIDKVQDDYTPLRVKMFENEVAKYDIKDSYLYDRDYDQFVIIFVQDNGKIVATFDDDGNIVNAFEYHLDVRVPRNLIDGVYKQYPGWTAEKSKYLVSYGNNKDVKKVYKLVLAKNDTRKRLKLFP